MKNWNYVYETNHLETIEILGDNKILQTLRASQKDFKSGRAYTHDEVWKE